MLIAASIAGARDVLCVKSIESYRTVVLTCP